MLYQFTMKQLLVVIVAANCAFAAGRHWEVLTERAGSTITTMLDGTADSIEYQPAQWTEADALKD